MSALLTKRTRKVKIPFRYYTAAAVTLVIERQVLSEASGKEYFSCTDCRIFPKLAHVGNSAQWVIDCVVVQTDIVMKASPSTANVERSFSTTNATI